MLKSVVLAALLAASASPVLAQSTAAAASGKGTAAAASSATPAPVTNDATAAALAKLRQVCAADFAKACPNAKPNTPEATQCIRDNFSSLGEPCQGAIMEYIATRGAG